MEAHDTGGRRAVQSTNKVDSFLCSFNLACGTTTDLARKGWKIRMEIQNDSCKVFSKWLNEKTAYQACKVLALKARITCSLHHHP
jgi:hypothetical protein